MTKKYFGTDGIRGRVGESLINPEFVLKLGWAAGKVLSTQPGDKVLIGKDTRISGYLLESALQAGLSAAGVDILLLGPMPTPAIAYLTRTLRAAAGIVISASHNPYYDNGIKFFNADGSKLDDQHEAEIEALLDQSLSMVPPAKLGKAKRVADAAGRYIEYCKSTIPIGTRLAGLKIVVDCAHGATYHVAPDVFTELGADVITIGAKPNGLNINDGTGSTHPDVLLNMVVQHQADLGIAFDGDGDRVVMVDHTGTLVDGDELLYIIARDRQLNQQLHGGVVGTVMTNFGLERRFQSLGIPFCRTQVGDRHVMAELLKQRWKLGGEASGHIVCLDKTSTGDGIISALQVLYAMVTQGRSLKEMIVDLEKVPQRLINVPVLNQQAVCQSPEIIQAVSRAEKVLGNNGRILLRPSGTEPLVRVMVEGVDPQQIQVIAEQLATTVSEFAAK